VVLEAQASGIPVIVTDRGGPAENIIPGETGIVVKADCVQSLFSAMASLTADPQRRLEMGRAARHYMEKRSFNVAFNETWEMYGIAGSRKQVMDKILIRP
jgi:glycosyltransferase involved in cell wall biosynthesis